MTQVFVFAHDRYETMTTSLMLEADSVEHKVLVSTGARAELFARGNRVLPERIHVTGEPDGLATARNAALDLMEEGEWALFLVDDMKQCYELDTYDEETSNELPITFENQHVYRKKFRKKISTKQLLDRASQSVPYLDAVEAHMLGFASVENPMFRKKKWGHNILADGRAWLVRKTHLRFNPKVESIDDYAWTAANIKAFNTVVVDRWILPDFQRYTAGGYGSRDNRMRRKIVEAQLLVEEFPDLLMYKNKVGWPEGSHIAFRPGLHHRARKIVT